MKEITMIRPKEQQEYEDFCDECNTTMNIRSKDGLQIYCPICWVPKPVPSEYLSTSTRVKETERRSSLGIGNM